MKLKLYGFGLLFCVIQVFSAGQISCINWQQADPSVFQPVPNANNQISPDYGLYWLKYDPSTGGEDYKRAYTPADYMPYFSNGTKNTNPDPKDDGGAARAQYIATQLKGFYDPNKPTIIFFHGWQPGKTALRQRIDLCYSYPNGANSSSSPLANNTLQYWQDSKNNHWKSWNVAVFYWTPFADEYSSLGSVDDAEAKIYSATIRQKMRWAYMKPGDTTLHYCEVGQSNCLMPTDAQGHPKDVGDLAYEAIVNAIPSINNQQEFRLAGQSLGAQLATVVAQRLADNNPTLMPTRLVLLDPYMTLGHLDGIFGNQSVADRVNQEVQDIQSHHIPVSEYRTSTISHFPTGDWDAWLESHVAYERLYPNYIQGVSGMELLEAQHRSSIYLYFQSARAPATWNNQGSVISSHSYINAQSTNDQVNLMTALGRLQTGGGSETNFQDTQDDMFNPGDDK